MRGTGIIIFALFAVLAIGGPQVEAASASKPAAAEYKFCVKLLPRKLRYEGQPTHVATGCHSRLLVFKATHTWEVQGESGWSGSYEVENQETFVFSANNDPLCALVGGKTASGYGGEILLNESTQPGKVICVQQAETWYTKEIKS
jgi:hypothetical protein